MSRFQKSDIVELRVFDLDVVCRKTGDEMISITDKGSCVDIGSITEAQLQILVKHLGETDLDDQNYYIDRRTIDMIKAVAADYAAVLEMLERALGDRDGVDIAWTRS